MGATSSVPLEGGWGAVDSNGAGDYAGPEPYCARPGLPLMALPHELVVGHVMGQLEGPDRAALAATCRAMHDAHCAHATRLGLASAADASACLAKRGGLARFRRVEELRIVTGGGCAGPSRWVHDVLEAAARQLPLLRRVHLDTRSAAHRSSAPDCWCDKCLAVAHSSDADADILDALAEQLPGLRELRWSSQHLTRRACEAIACLPGLEVLEVASPDAIQAGSIAELAPLVGMQPHNAAAAAPAAGDDAARGRLRRLRLSLGAAKSGPGSGTPRQRYVPADCVALALLLGGCEHVALRHEYESAAPLVGSALVLAAKAAGAHPAPSDLVAAAAAAASAASLCLPRLQPRLRSLELSLCEEHTQACWEALLCLPTLETLSVQWPCKPPPQLSDLSALPRLRELHFGGRLRASDVAQLACCAALESLHATVIDTADPLQRAVASAAASLVSCTGGQMAAAFALGVVEATFHHGGAGAAGASAAAGGLLVWAGGAADLEADLEAIAGEQAAAADEGTQQQQPAGGARHRRDSVDIAATTLPQLRRLEVDDVAADVLEMLPRWAPGLTHLAVRRHLLPAKSSCHGAHLLSAFAAAVGHSAAVAAIGGGRAKLPCLAGALRGIGGCSQLEQLALPPVLVGVGCRGAARAMDAVARLTSLTELEIDAAAPPAGACSSCGCECVAGRAEEREQHGAAPPHSAPALLGSEPGAAAGCAGTAGCGLGGTGARAPEAQRVACASAQQRTWGGWLRDSFVMRRRSQDAAHAVSCAAWLLNALQSPDALPALRVLRLNGGSAAPDADGGSASPRSGRGASGAACTPSPSCVAAAMQRPGVPACQLAERHSMRRLTMPLMDGGSAKGVAAALQAAAAAALACPCLERVTLVAPCWAQHEACVGAQQLVQWRQQVHQAAGRFVELSVVRASV